MITLREILDSELKNPGHHGWTQMKQNIIKRVHKELVDMFSHWSSRGIAKSPMVYFETFCSLSDDKKVEEKKADIELDLKTQISVLRAYCGADYTYHLQLILNGLYERICPKKDVEDNKPDYQHEQIEKIMAAANGIKEDLGRLMGEGEDNG